MPVSETYIPNDPPGMKSEVIHEILSYRPYWLIRKGNIVFLIIVTLAISSTWFIKYPDLIKGPIRLVSVNAPALLTAKVEGKLERLLVTNEQEVSSGQPLAFLESTAQHEQVLELHNWINAVQSSVMSGNLDILAKKPLSAFTNLGEMQPAYQKFQDFYWQTIHLLADGYYRQKKADLFKDLEYIKAVQLNGERQRRLLEMDYELQAVEYNAKEKLLTEKVLAPLELNQDKSKMIAKERNLSQLDYQQINHAMAEHNKQKELSELKKRISDQQHEFRSALLTLKSEIEDWSQRYTVTAPTNGKVFFVSFLQQNQLLVPDQELFYIQQPETSIYGEMLVGQHGLGKLKAGQKVIIRTESYPSQEFGYLTGHISYISNFPDRKDSFVVKVELPTRVRTSHNKELPFRNGLNGMAEAITDDRSLFDRFASQVMRNIEVK